MWRGKIKRRFDNSVALLMYVVVYLMRKYTKQFQSMAV
nr:MAG TPA: hypothetical protein [Siphoviridae sp. ctEdl3]